MPRRGGIRSSALHPSPENSGAAWEKMDAQNLSGRLPTYAWGSAQQKAILTLQRTAGNVALAELLGARFPRTLEQALLVQRCELRHCNPPSPCSVADRGVAVEQPQAKPALRNDVV